MVHTGRAVIFESVEDLAARIDDPGLDVAELGGHLLGERRDRVGVGDVQCLHDRLAARRLGLEVTDGAKHWLAERGYLAVTFDYRGIGESRCGPLRALEVDILGWARDDCSAVLDDSSPV